VGLQRRSAVLSSSYYVRVAAPPPTACRRWIGKSVIGDAAFGGGGYRPGGGNG